MTTNTKGGFLQVLEEAASHSHDIDELAAHLRALPEIRSVEVRNYLVKTDPPIDEQARNQELKGLKDFNSHQPTKVLQQSNDF